MTTGMHVVADIACAKCLNVVGWKYVSALRPASSNMFCHFFLQHTHVCAPTTAREQIHPGSHVGTLAHCTNTTPVTPTPASTPIYRTACSSSSSSNGPAGSPWALAPEMHVPVEITYLMYSPCAWCCCGPQEAASEESQKYKEGKFILERIHVVESDSNSNMSPPRFRPFAHPMHRSDSSGSDSY
jgi:hypothetical protein